MKIRNILLFFLVFLFSEIIAQDPNNLGRLKKQYDSLKTKENSLKSRLDVIDEYFEKLEGLDRQVEEIKSIKRNAVGVTRELVALESDLIAISKKVSDSTQAYLTAIAKRKQLAPPLSSLKDTIEQLKLTKKKLQTRSDRDRKVEEIQNALRGRVDQKMSISDPPKSRQTGAMNFLYTKVFDVAVELKADSIAMDTTTLHDKLSFLDLLSRNMTNPKEISDTIKFIKKLSETFFTYHRAVGLLNREYDESSIQQYRTKLTSLFLHNTVDQELRPFLSRVDSVEHLLANYCVVTKNFWLEVRKITNLIPEIAQPKLERFSQRINPQYEYLKKLSKPVVANLKEAEKKADAIIPKLKCQ